MFIFEKSLYSFRLRLCFYVYNFASLKIGRCNYNPLQQLYSYCTKGSKVILMTKNCSRFCLFWCTVQSFSSFFVAFNWKILTEIKTKQSKTRTRHHQNKVPPNTASKQNPKGVINYFVWKIMYQDQCSEGLCFGDDLFVFFNVLFWFQSIFSN